MRDVDISAQQGDPPVDRREVRQALDIGRPTNRHRQRMALVTQAGGARTGVAAADEILTPDLRCAASGGGIKFCNAAFDARMEAARAAVHAPQRPVVFEKARVIFKREQAWSRVAPSSACIPLRKHGVGLVIAPNGSVDVGGAHR